MTSVNLVEQQIQISVPPPLVKSQSLLPTCKVSPTLIKSIFHSRLIYDEFPPANQDILLKQNLYKIQGEQ